MSDFFDQLRRPSSPRRPNPAFVAILRRQLQEELHMATSGSASTDTSIDLGIVHVKVPDADRALAFYSGLLDWQSEPFRADTHTAHYIVNTGLLTVLTDDPTAPPVRLYFPVDDVRAASATLESLGGRTSDASLEADGGGWAQGDDGQGTTIGIWRPGRDHGTTQELRPPRGEIGYVTFHVADGDRAAAFYQGLLGWRFDGPRPNGYRHVVDSDPSLGFYGGHAEPSITLYVRVRDLADVSSRVPGLGGTVSEPSDSPTGRSASCTDDQGTTFVLWQAAPGY